MQKPMKAVILELGRKARRYSVPRMARAVVVML